MSSSLIHLLLFGLRAPPPGEAWPVSRRCWSCWCCLSSIALLLRARIPCWLILPPIALTGREPPPADPGGARREAERADAGRDCCGGAEAWDRRDAAEEGRGGPPAEPELMAATWESDADASRPAHRS
eukprot:CAMPEP_0114120730 /NCGR_PEP_ID=MMETSP0043_2-20121206/6809_1 /TAXON_ID=464988 /ORGANISM="Hemiselmis andersenii, Strain CCMP644" /LENGTH=127 /DNA_ID=CAMNT_0001213381 /DNA_START=489 /DNA_END=868 /DNA_ORIENTATION=-